MKDSGDAKPVAGPYPKDSAKPRCKAFEPFPGETSQNPIGYNCGLREGHEGNHTCACCCGHEWDEIENAQLQKRS